MFILFQLTRLYTRVVHGRLSYLTPRGDWAQRPGGSPVNHNRPHSAVSSVAGSSTGDACLQDASDAALFDCSGQIRNSVFTEGRRRVVAVFILHIAETFRLLRGGVCVQWK